MRHIIDIHDAVARHPVYRLAHPVDFQFDKGEQLAIVGDNGAGKSLLVDMITGKHPLIDDGKGSYIHYDFTPRESKMVYNNIKHITFEDAYGTTEGHYYYQIRFNQTEFDDKQHLFTLSSGELRKYQLKKVLEDNPRVLIMDNPFIGLDVNARKMLDDTLTRLIKETDLQVILVLSKTDDMPQFVTHVVEVKDKTVGEKQTVITTSNTSRKSRKECFQTPRRSPSSISRMKKTSRQAFRKELSRWWISRMSASSMEREPF